MNPLRHVIPNRLPNEWQHPGRSTSIDDPLQLLAKLADCPNGLELTQAFHEFYREVRTPQQPISELVKGRAGSRVVLLDALAQAKSQLIITSPWLSRRSIDSELILRMTALLNRGCYLHIGWGYSHDIKGVHPRGNIIHITNNGQCVINGTADTGGNYDAFPDLTKLAAKYPEQFHMKLLGTHEKYIICDDEFALLGSHNTLSSLDTFYAPREIGIKTTDKTFIKNHTEDFFSASDLRSKAELQLKAIS